MNSSSKIHASTSNSQVVTWNVADLDIASNVSPRQEQAEQILALFATGQKNKSNDRKTVAHSTLHPKELAAPLSNWLPGDLDLQSGLQSEKTDLQQWDFIEQSQDFFNIPEQQIWKEKFEAEQDRIELVKQARAEAEEILNQARAEAERIIALAQNEIDQAKKKGYEAARNELQEAVAATCAVVEETHQWQSEFMSSGEQILIGMLKDIAQTMFGEGIRLDPSALQINLNRVMENAQRLGDLNIFLNPQDAELLDPSWSNYQLLITGNKVRIIPSEKILPGGCIVKGSVGLVDARVETQLASVLNTISETGEADK